MNRSILRLCWATVALAGLGLWGCGKPADDSSLVIPRGATLGIRTIDAITDEHSPGSRFRAALELPLSNERTVYVNAGARVQGVIEEVKTDQAGNTQVVVRLVSLELPGGKSIEIKTDPLSRDNQSAPTSAGTFTATTGIEDLVRQLAEVEGAGSYVEASSESSGTTLLAADSPIVFTLSSDLVIPEPESPVVTPTPASPEKRGLTSPVHQRTIDIDSGADIGRSRQAPLESETPSNSVP